MEPFLISFDHGNIPDLPVFAEDEEEARALAQSEINAELGDGALVGVRVRPGEVVSVTVPVTLTMDTPAFANEFVRVRMPSRFCSNQMRLGAGEIICNTDDEGPGTYTVPIPVEIVTGPGLEHPEVRADDARQVIENYCR